MFWGNTFQLIMLAYGMLMLFTTSLFFGLTILLIRYLMPRGTHRLRRGDR